MPALTKRIIDGSQPGDSQRIVWDSELRGFGLLVLPSGTKSFVVQYRNAAARSRRFTIGRYPVFTVDEARKKAMEVLLAAANGQDPLELRREVRTTPNVAALFERYLSEHVAKHNAKTTAAEVGRLVERILKPSLGHLSVKAVATSDMLKLHHELAATPRQANNVLAIASKAFTLAEAWGLRPRASNPVHGIKRYEENERERFLSAPELERLGAALEEASGAGLPWKVKEPASKHLPADPRTRLNPAGLDAIRLLLFTGARLTEILTLEWVHVDLEAGTVALPGRKGKKRRPHPVSEVVIELLKALAKAKRGRRWVLPGDEKGERHVSKTVVEGVWQRLRSHAGLDDVRIHDLRHTVGTVADKVGASAFLIQHLLRHRNVAITARYVNSDADPIRDVSNRVGDRLSSGLAGKAKKE